MWTSFPPDILSHIFSFLSPDSLACAKSACRYWHTCANVYPLSVGSSAPLTCQRCPWFLGLPTRNRGLNNCYVHNPVEDKWHVLSMEFLSVPIQPISSIGNMILSRLTNSTILRLVICNPFTRQFGFLPMLNKSRTNPAIGVVVLASDHLTPFPRFQVYVVGGTSKAPWGGGATYEPTIEMFDSAANRWMFLGEMPVEYAVRLTVWTPNVSVYSDRVLYWMTSARVYTVMGLEIRTNKWVELGVPLADKLEFGALALRNGKLTLIGGTCGGAASVWELNETDSWCLTERVPSDLTSKLLDGKSSWGSTKCVGGDGVICLYRDIGKGMVVWSEVKERGVWEWNWIDGRVKGKGQESLSMAVRGVFVHPNLLKATASDEHAYRKSSPGFTRTTSDK